VAHLCEGPSDDRKTATKTWQETVKNKTKQIFSN